MWRFKSSSTRKTTAMIAYLLAALAGAVGQFCFKMLSGQMGVVTSLELALSPYLWVGMLSYFSVMAFFISGLKLWGELSALYPIYGSTFVWAMFIAAIVLGESITPGGIVGTALIVVGIALLNTRLPRGSRRQGPGEGP